MQTIILSGGLGTNITVCYNNKSKALAGVNGKPFLFWLIRFWQQQGITDFIFSIGNLHEQVEDFDRYGTVEMNK